MDLRKLKAKLDALRASGVEEYEDLPDGGVKLRFRGEMATVAVDTPADVEALDLPAGVIDPREAIRAIYEGKSARKRTAA